jgi:hypothetical protein
MTARMTFGAVLISSCLLAGAAPAQEFVPPNEQVDKELDESLQREYGPDGQPVEPGAEAPPAREIPPPPPPIDEDDEEDEWGLKLGALAAHYYTWIRDVNVSYREGLSGGARIELDRSAGAAKYDPEHSQTYRAWFDIGRWITLEAGFRRTVYRSEAQQSETSFTYGSTTFATGSLVETKLDQATIDADFVFKPVNNRWFELALHFGSRYLYTETQVRDPGNPQTRTERQRLEMALPMIGLGLAFRPIRELEFFARGRIGYFGYDRDEAYVWDDDDDVHHVTPKEKSATSGELDAGVQLLLGDTIGIVAGWRLDYLDVEREVPQREEKIRSLSHGAYGGLILQF